MLRRDLAELAAREFDVVVVGGGVFGCAAAWDAAQRGLSVALLERRDFSAAASANSFKVVHGGIRYVQHADVARVRESSHERSTLMRIAPHLVEPLPIVVPTYGHGMQGKGILRVGCWIYDLLTADRNRGVATPSRRVPFARSLSRAEVIEEFPGLDRDGLTGGVLFHDGQMHNPTRLAFSYVRSAAEKGAVAANYAAVVGFLREEDRITGVRVRDELGGDELEVRGKVVVNACGGWAPRLLDEHLEERASPKLTFSRDACFVVPRRLVGDRALAVLGRTKDPDAILARPKRHLFLAPWRDYTLVGVWHKVWKPHPDTYTVTEEELQLFLDEINEGYSAANLTLDDVSMWNAGLVLFGDNAEGAEDLSYGKRSMVLDHAVEHGIQGLITLVGVRYTTSRGIADRVVDLVFRKIGKTAPRCRTAETPLFGGDVGDFDEYLERHVAAGPAGVGRDTMGALLRNYGTAHGAVLRYSQDDPGLLGTVGSSTVLKAELVHAVREEMAVKLSDVVLRRTDLGTGENPGEAALRECADIVGKELGWSAQRTQQEIDETASVYPGAMKVR